MGENLEALALNPEGVAMKARNLAAVAAGLILSVPASAQANVFNGRISFSSFRTRPVVADR